jgi:hypothetical protein
VRARVLLLALALCKLACGSAPTRAQCEAELEAAGRPQTEQIKATYYGCYAEAVRADPENQEGAKTCDCSTLAFAVCAEEGISMDQCAKQEECWAQPGTDLEDCKPLPQWL